MTREYLIVLDGCDDDNAYMMWWKHPSLGFQLELELMYEVLPLVGATYLTENDKQITSNIFDTFAG